MIPISGTCTQYISKLIGYSKYKDDVKAGYIVVDANLGGVSGSNGGWHTFYDIFKELIK